MEEKYFAASNSGRGFVSYFDSVFSPSRFEKVYIIKGGPGTGKSYFMKSAANAAEKAGKKTECYYCSSDQNSLDGLVIDEKIALLDGTAPHDADPAFPGAVENIIDLGRFWNPDELAKNRETIEKLNEKKKSAYARVYHYLAACREIGAAEETLLLRAADMRKMRRCAELCMKKIPCECEYHEKIGICDSVGMEGRVRFDTFEKKAKRIYSINDIFGSGHLFLNFVREIASEKRMDVVLSFDPVIPERLDCVYMPKSGILFALGCSPDPEKTKCINMSRFILREKLCCIKKALKSAGKLRAAALDEALAALGDVKNVHFEIEKIYEEAMDFKSKEEYCQDFIKNLINGLK